MPLARTLRALVLSAVAALLVAAPAHAVIQSDNVELLGKLPAVAPIGGHFDRSGDTLFVTGAGGLQVFDVSEPASPVPLGALALPHFENEDVDFGHVAGRDVVIISNDPSFNLGAFGAIYVVDVTNPSVPTLLSVTPTKLPRQLGGPTDTNGHVANCIQGCDYLYTTGDDPGISIYDLRDPENPRFVKQVAMPGPLGDEQTPGFTHDVFTDAKGVAWVTGEDGTFGFDVRDPENPRLRYRTDDRIKNTDGLGGPGVLNPEGEGPLDFLHHNMMRTDVSVGQGETGVAAGRTEGRGNVVAITEEDYLRPTCEGASQGSTQTWQITDAKNSDGSQRLVLLDQWTTEGNTLASGEGRDPLTVNCSAHWFDVSGTLIAQAWYDQGVRFLDISDPRDIKQVGFYATTGTFWAAYFSPKDPSVVYALDTTGALDVLRIDRTDTARKTAPVPARWTAPESAQTDAVKLGVTHDEAEASGHGHGAEVHDHAG